MAWTSGFFNSSGGDRRYNAEQISEMFRGLITNGIYEAVGNKLVVEASSGMTVKVGTGRGWFDGRWVNNSSEYFYTLEDSDVLYSRYVAVCIRVDKTQEGRSANLYFKYGEFAETPTKPEMEHSEYVNEYCLAYILINAGATEITAVDIEDTRSTNLCGWVTGLIDQVDIHTFYKQWEALFYEWFNSSTEVFENQFNDWFDGLETMISEDTEAQLLVDVQNLKQQIIKSTGTFDGLGWIREEDGTYTQIVTVNGVTLTNDIVVSPTNQYMDDYENMQCRAIGQGINSITFKCDHPDDVNMQIEVLIFNV